MPLLHECRPGYFLLSLATRLNYEPSLLELLEEALSFIYLRNLKLLDLLDEICVFQIEQSGNLVLFGTKLRRVLANRVKLNQKLKK